MAGESRARPRIRTDASTKGIAVSNDDKGFPLYYSRRKQALGIQYEADEFLYPHDAPWPEASFDYPYGQAPQVTNIPAAETQDWANTIGKYYTENMLGSASDPTPFGVASAKFARDHVFQDGLTGYAHVSDDEFIGLICEGLYSKFLSALDPQDIELFGLKPEDVAGKSKYEYFKSDYRCMMVVQQTWPNEHACPTIVLVRRVRGSANRYADQGAYELVAIAMARFKSSPPLVASVAAVASATVAAGGANAGPAAPAPVIGVYEFPPDLIFWYAEHKDLPGWFLAKYFVLQGAIHRINLIDHVKVHFPPDTINAVTKSVLPVWHVVSQLLMPHFRLTLPVNNTVLEGERSLINRDTWYPWSPFVAKGNEIRKLFPFAWGGASYYGEKYYGKDAAELGRNSSYPAFRYSTDPNGMPDADDPQRLIPNFIGMDCSRYGAFLKSYYDPILAFATQAVALLGPPPAKGDETSLAWLEIKHWAYQVSRMLPGFPDENRICEPGELARVCAMVIWNAAVVHSSDHTTLHLMMDQKPVPFVIRVPPPANRDQVIEETVSNALGAQLQGYITQAIQAVLAAWEHGNPFKKIAGDLFEKGLDAVGDVKLPHDKMPLCWPTDLVYARMADLLFYRPHNTSLLYFCEYEFERTNLTAAERALEQEWRAAGRPVLTDEQKQKLRELRKAFQGALDAVNALYYRPDGKPLEPQAGAPDDHEDTDDAMTYLNRYAFPKLRPGTGEAKASAMLEREACLGAGVQY